MQKFSDDTAIDECVQDGQEREYRALVEDLWCKSIHIQLHISKTKELLVDFRRSGLILQPISNEGVNVVVRPCKYLLTSG